MDYVIVESSLPSSTLQNVSPGPDSDPAVEAAVGDHHHRAALAHVELVTLHTGC